VQDPPEKADSPGSDLVNVSAGLNIDLGLGELISRVVGAPLEQAAGILRDVLGQIRFELSLRLLERAQRKVKAAGFEQQELGQVDLTKLFPILEWGSIATDDSMQERWASLLANAIVDPEGFSHSSAEILRQLDPLDARMLDLLYERSGGTPNRDGGYFASGWVAGSFDHQLGLGAGTVKQARLDNLVRLGLAFHPTARLGRIKANRPPIERDKIGLSALGAVFVAACWPPRQELDG
jgi:Abortive infection alpha